MASTVGGGRARRRRGLLVLTGIAMVAASLAVVGANVIGVSPVQAVSHPSGSTSVAFIGSAPSQNGGELFHADAAFSSITFADLAPADVNAANLAAYDTVVLNVASTEMACTTNTLSASAKTDLVSWLGAGNKLIIWDSECPAQDYSWLPFPFTTNNPGAQGANGTLTIAESDNLMSSNSADPKFIDANAISTGTDAIGDANVLTTQDPHLCVNATAVNANGFTGPVHVYASYAPAAGHAGLLIYSGMDMDLMGQTPDNTSGSNALNKIFLQELQQSFDPSSGLPCGVAVVGITLKPADATNDEGTDHTVTANLTNQAGAPQSGVAVTFSFESGSVNSGATGTCAPNADCTSDSNGNVNFTYHDNNGVGDDSIKACFTPSGSTTPVCTPDVAKHWESTTTSSSSSSSSTSSSSTSSTTSSVPQCAPNDHHTDHEGCPPQMRPHHEHVAIIIVFVFKAFCHHFFGWWNDIWFGGGGGARW